MHYSLFEKVLAETARKRISKPALVLGSLPPALILSLLVAIAVTTDVGLAEDLATVGAILQGSISTLLGTWGGNSRFAPGTEGHVGTSVFGNWCSERTHEKYFGSQAASFRQWCSYHVYGTFPGRGATI